MVEIRYRVVNKYLHEIRDIDVKSSEYSGAMNITTPLHCKPGEYLDTNQVFHDNSFQTSLNSGLLRTYLRNGDVVQVYYDTVKKCEVQQPNGFVPNNNNKPSLEQMLGEVGISLDDLKEFVANEKAKKQAQVQQVTPVTNTPINTNTQITVNQNIENTQSQPIQKETTTKITTENNTDNTVLSKTKNKSKKTKRTALKTKIKPVENLKTELPKQTENSEQTGIVDNSKNTVDNFQIEQQNFSNMAYQQKLTYIKQCNNIQLLQWIQATYKQVAIFNSASKQMKIIQEQNK